MKSGEKNKRKISINISHSMHACAVRARISTVWMGGVWWQCGVCCGEGHGNLAHAAERGVMIWQVWLGEAGQAEGPTLQGTAKSVG